MNPNAVGQLIYWLLTSHTVLAEILAVTASGSLPNKLRVFFSPCLTFQFDSSPKWFILQPYKILHWCHGRESNGKKQLVVEMTGKYRIRLPINQLKSTKWMSCPFRYSWARGVLVSGIRAQAQIYLESLAGFASLGTWEKLLSFRFHAKIFETL